MKRKVIFHCSISGISLCEVNGTFTFLKKFRKISLCPCRIHKTMRCHSPNKGQKAVMSSQNDLNADNHLDDTKTSQEIPKVAKPRRRKFSFVSSRYVNNNGVQKNRKGFSIIKKAALSRTTDNPGSDTSIRSIQDLEEKCWWTHFDAISRYIQDWNEF